MQLDFLFVAERIEPLGSGRFNAYGIGSIGLICSRFPAQIDQFLLVAGFLIGPAELGKHFLFETKVISSDGAVIGEGHGLDTVWAAPQEIDPNAPARCVRAVPFAGMIFPTAGPYEIQVLIDGAVMGSLSWSLRLDPSLYVPR